MPASREGACSEGGHSGAGIKCSSGSRGQSGLPPRYHSKKGSLIGIASQASCFLWESGRLFPLMMLAMSCYDCHWRLFMFIPSLSFPSIFPCVTSTKPCVSSSATVLPVFHMRRLTLQEDRSNAQCHTAREYRALDPSLELA